jgi:hypothetical protein
MTDDDWEALRSLAFSIPAIGIGGWVIWKQLGGWRGMNTRYFFGPLLVALVGLFLMITGGLSTGFWIGLSLMTFGIMAAPLLPTLRFVYLSRIMRRLDDYIEGTTPLPFPDDDADARRDLVKAERLLADPSLLHRFDPVVVERVRALVQGRPLPEAVPARD